MADSDLNKKTAGGGEYPYAKATPWHTWEMIPYIESSTLDAVAFLFNVSRIQRAEQQLAPFTLAHLAAYKKIGLIR